MKIARLTGIMLAAVFAVSLVAASIAMAEPQFVPASGTFTGTSGAGTLVANNGTEVVKCATDTSTGLIGSATTVDNVTVHFLNCLSSGVKGSGCTVKSTGAPAEGLIITNTLNGVLGLSLPHLGTGAALLLSPASGKIFVSLEANKCTEATKVTGSVAGEVSPIGKSVKSGTLTFTAVHPGSAKQSIATFDPSTGGVAVSPELVAFSTTASEETTESVTYATATEVT